MVTLRDARRLVYAETLEGLYADAEWGMDDDDGRPRPARDMVLIAQARLEFATELEERLTRIRRGRLLTDRVRQASDRVREV